MKYLLLTTVTLGMLFSSCARQRTCPAYMELNDVKQQEYTEKGFKEVREV
ncbi:hypothetical protein RCC89_11005 [Cytophagaceae bacterium ABcell3]|nr:hypothetical protein RCC89_11005 [Cytophagaceae bacterium ABcell3]